ncbi:MAG TPA: RDD family protein [bacterium]|nr:RDD family protein [bacterium]
MEKKTCERHPDREASGFCAVCGAPVCPECERLYGGKTYCAKCLKKGKKAAVLLKKKGPNADRQPGAEVEGDAEEGKPRAGAREKISAGLKSIKPGRLKLQKEAARILAKAIDFILIIMITMPVSWLFRLISMGWMSDVGGIGYRLSVYVALITVASLYFIISHSISGCTIGKWLFGVRVVLYGGGGKITVSSAFWRWIGFLAAFSWAYVGYSLMSVTLNWAAILRGKLPDYYFGFLGVAGIACVIMFSLGLLITFVGKYKRGFHDLLGGTIVERIEDKRRTADESKSG